LFTRTSLSPALEADPADLLFRRVAFRFMPLLFIGYVVAYLDRVNVGFAKLQMLNSLHLSEAAYGLGAGLFFIGYFLFEVPSNLLLHKLGARRWIARIMVTWALLSMANAWVSTPLEFYVVRFFLGVAEAGFFPGLVLYLTYWYPSHRRGKMFALFAAAVPMSGLIGSPAISDCLVMSKLTSGCLVASLATSVLALMTPIVSPSAETLSRRSNSCAIVKRSSNTSRGRSRTGS